VEQLGLVKLFLKEIYIKVRMGEDLFGSFPVKLNMKQGDALSSLLFNVALESA
jgi:hypothetical protein